MHKDKDLCLLLKIFDKSIDVGKSMKKKYGKKILDNSAGKDFAKIAGKKG